MKTTDSPYGVHELLFLPQHKAASPSFSILNCLLCPIPSKPNLSNHLHSNSSQLANSKFKLETDFLIILPSSKKMDNEYIITLLSSKLRTKKKLKLKRPQKLCHPTFHVCVTCLLCPKEYSPDRRK
jgi:hypothetical protein